MLLAHLAAVVFFSFTFLLRTPQISTSLALILSWAKLPLLPDPPLGSTEFNPYISNSPSPFQSSDLLVLPSPQSLHVSPVFQPQPSCLNHIVITGLVSEAFCSIHDEFTIVPPRYYTPFHGLAAPLLYPEWRLRNLYSVFTRHSHHLFAHKLLSLTTLCCVVSCIIAFAMSHRGCVANNTSNIINDGKMPELIQDLSIFSNKSELLPTISEIVFGAPSFLPLHEPEIIDFTSVNDNFQQQDNRAADDVYDRDPEDNSILSALPQFPFISTSEISSNDFIQPNNPTSVAPVQIPLFPKPCNDQHDIELSPLPLTISIVPATPRSSPTFSPATSSPESPLYSPVSSPVSSPITSPSTSPPLSPAPSMDAETTFKNNTEDTSIDTPVHLSKSFDENPTSSETEGTLANLRFSPILDSAAEVDEAAFEAEAAPDSQILADLVHASCNVKEAEYTSIADSETSDTTVAISQTPQSNDNTQNISIELVSSALQTLDSHDFFESKVEADVSDPNISWADDVHETFYNKSPLSAPYIQLTESEGKVAAHSPEASQVAFVPSELNPSIEYTGVFHTCCALAGDNFTPDNWDTYQWSPCWTSKSRFRPKDSDCILKSTRFAVDNIDFMKCSGVRPNVRFSYQPLEKALAPFEPSNVDCFNPRLDGNAHLTAFCYGIVDFGSVEQAMKAFNHLQGRRIAKGETHWRLEVLDPEDESCGGRKLVDKPTQPQRRRILLTPGSSNGERRRPGSDIRAVLTANAAHNKTKVTRTQAA